MKIGDKVIYFGISQPFASSYWRDDDLDEPEEKIFECEIMKKSEDSTRYLLKKKSTGVEHDIFWAHRKQMELI